MGLKQIGLWSWATMFLLYLCLNFITSVTAATISDTESIDTRKFGRRKLDDIAGSISIDCGIPDDHCYEESVTHLKYVSDIAFIDTGVNENVSHEYSSNVSLPFTNLRSFPEGTRNCYTLPPPEGKANIYLIRASFMYGNYDNRGKLPQFDLYVGVNMWDSVKFDSASHIVVKEIIHVPSEDKIYVCLVNTGLGTPFISALELRHFHSSTYLAPKSTALVLYRRLDFGSTTGRIVRYHDDVYDRIWSPYECNSCESVNTSHVTDLYATNFNLPAVVMETASRPTNPNGSLDFEFNIGDPTLDFYVYLHFAELEILQENQCRKFNITLNGNLLNESLILKYLSSTTVSSRQAIRGEKLSFSLYRNESCGVPPILNAMEIYMVKDFNYEATKQDDVNAITEIKSRYTVQKHWQGDPCAPVTTWDGLNCSFSGYDPPRIISLNLSSSRLTGKIYPSFAKIKSLQHLDLSNNSLTGPVPMFLSELPNLKTLNLEGNRLSGSVPSILIEQSKKGLLVLSLGGNSDLCTSPPCEKKNRSIMIPLVATIVPFVGVFLIALAILWSYGRRKGAKISIGLKKDELPPLKSDTRQFSYLEIVRITNNFQTVIGKGGFGTVYFGESADGRQVAVKMLSPSSSTNGSSQFHTEAQLLMRVHHRNLASFVGYCSEGTNFGIIYEYMACGNLEKYISDKGIEPLSWKERLQIALDSAQGIEYLHYGCKPPIIHRDLKSANILLNESLQAKIADFGISKLFPVESTSHLSTAVAGTIGYLDPEYYSSNRLTEKSDVYSFGVVLLELITGQPAIIRNHDQHLHIVKWVIPFLEGGDIRTVVDPRLEGKFDTNSAWKFMEIAMSCLPSISIQRPKISHVVAELKECLESEIVNEQNGLGVIDVKNWGSSNFVEMGSVDLESESIPEAR